MQFSPLCVPSNAFGNHDLSRLVTRIGAERARAVSLMLMTLPGMAFVYYGEEIGMENGHIPADMVQDPAEKAQKKRGTGRDPERTPMQWSAEKNAGFSNGPSTWLPVADNYPIRNVEAESEQPDSFLSLYRQLGKLRSGSDAIRYGNFTVLESGDEQVLMFERSHGHEPRFVTCVNFSEKPAKCHMPHGQVSISVSSVGRTDFDKSEELGLAPYEAVILKVIEPKQ
jgi:alpha-glucosidase